MAAHDPAARTASAKTAARARIQQLTDDQRQAMTQAARDALHQRDLDTVDQWARRVGRQLTDTERERWAQQLARERALRASRAAARARGKDTP
jgi:hypothetical protein